MNARTGKLSKREVETLNRAWSIVSDWIGWQEENGFDCDADGNDFDDQHAYDSAGNACVGLCDFIMCMKEA